MRIYKGHGTENDFVVLPDLDGALALTPRLVRALCDRHAGIGADGVLRVVRAENDPDGKPMSGAAAYFMDYRNADGSVAEMCGNGVRVFARYLQHAGLFDAVAGAELAVATRGGVRRVRVAEGGFTVEMGRPELHAVRPFVLVRDELVGDGRAVSIPNPHVVVPLASAEALAELDLTAKPTVEPAGPDGENVEFVVTLAPRHLRMRVHERGVGETRSCGTGICAAVAVAATADGLGADGQPWRVDVPGGTTAVSWRTDGEIELTGPAVLVAEVELDPSWLTVFGE